jgi:hypothetical protein
VEVSIIPLFENFEEKINEKLYQDIFKMQEYFYFSCQINQKEFDSKIDIENIYQTENKKMVKIM